VEVIVRHPKTDAEYGIDSADFRRGKHAVDPKTGELVTYEEAGYRIVSQMDGQPYHAPSERHAADQGKD
jgi:hypothetical protein